jgi:uncharacterized protein YndB with AHSA1/START domain
MISSSDKIEKSIVLRAPRERVWHAISDAASFGRWFGVEFDREFASGARMLGRCVPTQVDAEIAKAQESYAGITFEIQIERIEPMRLFSFRWHPFAIDPNVDYANEPTTLIEFVLSDADGGTKVTITESGFSKIPLERRVKAFEANDEGWEMQVQLLAKYLALASA